MKRHRYPDWAQPSMGGVAVAAAALVVSALLLAAVLSRLGTEPPVTAGGRGGTSITLLRDPNPPDPSPQARVVEENLPGHQPAGGSGNMPSAGSAPGEVPEVPPTTVGAPTDARGGHGRQGPARESGRAAARERLEECEAAVQRSEDAVDDPRGPSEDAAEDCDVDAARNHAPEAGQEADGRSPRANPRGSEDQNDGPPALQLGHDVPADPPGSGGRGRRAG